VTNNAVRRSARCATAQKRLHHNTSSIVFVLEQRLVFVALYTPPHFSTHLPTLHHTNRSTQYLMTTSPSMVSLTCAPWVADMAGTSEPGTTRQHTHTGARRP
jgi:hypothetical protein